MSSLTLRILTAVVLLAALLSILFLLPAVYSVLLLGAFVLVGAWEWSGFLYPGGGPGRALYTAFLGLLGGTPWLAFFGAGYQMVVLYVALIWWAGVAGWIMFTAVRVTGVGCAVAGILGLFPAWLALLHLLLLPDGNLLFLWLLAIVAAADIGAYFTGRSLGRRKLAPTISPGKTREGLFGGLVCATLAAIAGAAYFDLSLTGFALAGALIALISVIGDLTVSVFKRHAGLKDSGSLLPGHGGVMDRIDSLVAALPVFVVVLVSVGKA